MRYGSAGIGSLAHLAMELLQSRTGMELLHVPYKGAAPNAMALTAGEIDISFAGVSSSLAMVEAKRLNALAVSGLVRVPSMPDVPTIAESGYPGFDVTNTYGVLAPVGTPVAVLETLNAHVRAILLMDDVRAKFAMQGIDAGGSTPAAYRARDGGRGGPVGARREGCAHQHRVRLQPAIGQLRPPRSQATRRRPTRSQSIRGAGRIRR